MFDWRKLILLNLIVLNIALVILGFSSLLSAKPTLATLPGQEQFIAQNSLVQKWDYWRIRLRTTFMEEDWKTVLETGKNGWEMVNCDMESSDNSILCFFKRPI
jgi:uncharacterized membrane-anchored protein YitT (DUF2179 family)